MAKKPTSNQPATKPAEPTWQSHPSTYFGGQAEIDEVDLVARDMEARWGADRLRLMVDPELRAKFDSQRHKLDRAIWYGSLDDVRTEARRMIKAWKVLDAKATEMGRERLKPTVWEIPLPNGTVAALVRYNEDVKDVSADSRWVQIYTMDEIGRLIAGFPEIVKAKEIWKGAEITAVRTNIFNNTNALGLSMDDIDQPMPF